jgi:DNA-directed RNA polymerase subunit RPC12/RpoP
MQFYRCNNCGKIVKLGPKDIAVLYTIACLKCTKRNTLKPYDGEIHPTILDVEDEQAPEFERQLQEATVKRDAARLALDNLAGKHSALEHKFKRAKTLTEAEAIEFRDKIEASHAQLILAQSDFDAAELAYKLAKDKRENLGTRDAVRAGAAKAYSASENVAKTGKNRLYIGSRQYVSGYAKEKAAREGRILNVSVWSPGLNVAWVEGGVKAKAQFKMKLNPDNQYDTISAEVLDEFRRAPQMDATAFLELCRKKGKGSLLWYDRDGANRPTWTAMEIWCLLRAGYRFEFAERSAGKVGQKILLIPPN